MPRLVIDDLGGYVVGTSRFPTPAHTAAMARFLARWPAHYFAETSMIPFYDEEQRIPCDRTLVIFSVAILVPEQAKIFTFQILLPSDPAALDCYDTPHLVRKVIRAFQEKGIPMDDAARDYGLSPQDPDGKSNPE